MSNSNKIFLQITKILYREKTAKKMTQKKTKIKKQTMHLKIFLVKNPKNQT